jgi:CHAT domain-containing protein
MVSTRRRSRASPFYAGARALLVSHWAVDSQATVSLVSKAFGEVNADGKIGAPRLCAAPCWR